MVLTTAGKYLWERHTLPQVWVPVQVLNEQMREVTAQNPANRYVSVQFLADACSLPPRPATQEPDFQQPPNGETGHAGRTATWISVRQDNVRTVARDGKLVLVEAEGLHPASKQRLYWDLRDPCTKARVTDFVQFYVPWSAAMPGKLAPGQTLWALVSVPDEGPPRPIGLALSDAGGFHPLGQK